MTIDNSAMTDQHFSDFSKSGHLLKLLNVLKMLKMLKLLKLLKMLKLLKCHC